MNSKYESFWRKDAYNFCEACSTFSLTNNCELCEDSVNWADIEKTKFCNETPKKHTDLGNYYECLVLKDDRYIEHSTAGGFTTGLLNELISNGHVDAIISPFFDRQSQSFKYGCFENVDDLPIQQRSIYTALNFQDALDIIDSKNQKYAITGIPTAIQYIEHLKTKNETYKKRVAFTIGLVSGGYKVKNYEEYLSEKARAPIVEKWNYVSFRDKKTNYSYSGQNYFFVKKSSNKEYSLRSGQIRYNWPYGLLKEFSSDFCGDTFNICSDVTVMDAWLPRFSETAGRTISIVRNKAILKVINKANFDAKVITENEVVESQAGGLRHKTIGFTARIKIYTLLGSKVPDRLKRISHSYTFVDIIEHFLRLRVSWLSRVTYKKYGDAKKLEKSISRYVIPLKLINKLKHTLNLRG